MCNVCFSWQDYQTRVQMATQACGFITIVGGTFLLHTTKDLDITRVDLEEMVRSNSTTTDGVAAASGSTLSSRSVRERRTALQASLELELGKGGMMEVKVDANDKGGGAGGGPEDEQHPLLAGASGASTNSSSNNATARKARASGLFGF